MSDEIPKVTDPIGPDRAKLRKENREAYERTYATLHQHRESLRRIATGGARPEDAKLIEVVASLALWELRFRDYENLAWG